MSRWPKMWLRGIQASIRAVSTEPFEALSAGIKVLAVFKSDAGYEPVLPPPAVDVKKCFQLKQ